MVVFFSAKPSTLYKTLLNKIPFFHLVSQTPLYHFGFNQEDQRSLWLLCPAYTNSLCHLSKLCGLPPTQAVKNSLCVLSIPHICAQTAYIFSLALINKSSFCFHTSQILLEKWLSSPVLSPWYTLSMGDFPHPQNHTKPSASHHPFTHHPSWMLGFQPAQSWASSAPSIFSLPLHRHFWVSSPMPQGRFVERTLRNFITIFKIFLKPLCLPGKLQ